jgi:hypothetical protein
MFSARDCDRLTHPCLLWLDWRHRIDNQVIREEPKESQAFGRLVLDEGLQGALLFDYRTGGGRETGPLSLFGDHAEAILGGFTTSLALTGSVFVAPNPSCPVTRQTTAAANAHWSGGGGRFGGGGASGRW